MKKFIIIAIILAIGWYGNYLYKQHGSIITQQSLTDFAYKNPTKCVTKDGRVIYGNLPQETVCIEEKPIEGALTVVPSRNSDKAVTSSFKCTRLPTISNSLLIYDF